MFWGLKITFENFDFFQFLPIKTRFLNSFLALRRDVISDRQKHDVFEFLDPTSGGQNGIRFDL